MNSSRAIELPLLRAVGRPALRWSAAAGVVLALAVSAAAVALPERSLVVVATGAGGSTALYAAEGAASGCTLVRSLPRGAAEVSISPDGSRVATVVYRGGRAHDLRLLSPRGRPGRTLGRLAGQSPTPPLWSEDGLRIAYGDGAGIVLVDIGSNARRRVSLPAREKVAYKPLAWSPDRSRIVVSTTWGYGPDYTLRNALQLIDLARASVRTLVRNPNPYAASFSADWSPDANAIVYDTGDPSEIFSIRPDGSRRTQLTDRNRRFGDRGPPYDVKPQWSPDGTRIAFTSTRDGISEVYVMAADGSGERRLTFSRRPTRGVPVHGSVLVAWSPDGARIGYHRVADGTSALATVDADGRGAGDLCRLPRRASVLVGVWPQR